MDDATPIPNQASAEPETNATESAPESAPANEPLLTEIEARVLGALMEKDLATPEHYPLTLSSLVAACNQKSNRDPVMSMETKVVEQVLMVLRRDKKLACLVHEAGARVPKFRHEVHNQYGLTPVEQAVMAELMLRGPQTLAELRNRVPRMVSDLQDGQVESALDALAMVRGVKMVAQLPKAHGRRESRYAHQLCGEVLTESSSGPVVIEAPPPPEAARLLALEEEVKSLKAELEDLREAFQTFRKSFE
ncbi:MAG: DUF480 domain-containing protein [Verrucomicrobia bacterium]|nr:DUF480 domain-containing protein [Verrucomicrobiota bacterium]MCH8513197.1 YceH family protein [Kiritimatiellia bacterium]